MARRLFTPKTGLTTLFVIAVMACVAKAGRDYYDLLGVPRDADVSVIKKSYRRLAKLYHPDKNPGDKKVEDKFKGISKAYEVLADPEKRQVYDQFGEEGLKQNGGGGPRGPGGPGGFFHHFQQGGGSGGGFRMEFDPNMFEDMFGGGSGGGFGGGGFGNQRRRHEQARRKVCLENKVCENGRCFMVKECKSS